MTEHHASPHLAHHFDDLAQQRESATLGMWAFLGTEVMFFGAVFTAFAVYRSFYTPAFAEAAHHMSMTLGTINTGVLLCSSFTVVMAVHAAQNNNRKLLVNMLLLTMLLGAIFLGIKGVEYYTEYKHALMPGVNFEYGHHEGQTPEYAPSVRLFMSFYFILTGIHATHMIVGLGIFAWLAWSAHRGKYSPEYYNPIEIGGLYWHFVDVVWIFLFPVLYLLRY
jgi:cytochrome c oxidase subunit III